MNVGNDKPTNVFGISRTHCRQCLHEMSINTSVPRSKDIIKQYINRKTEREGLGGRLDQRWLNRAKSDLAENYTSEVTMVKGSPWMVKV